MRIDKALLQWYRQNRRPLPWRQSADPYRVWVSEILLQQTRVEAVLPRYERFLARFVDVHALAAADIEQVLKEWEGLGYYSRARNLHSAARLICENGFPDSAKGWQRLPGIGEYTAGAVASICYGERVAAVDGNALRVFARLLAIHTPVREREAGGIIRAAIEDSLPRQGAGEFNQALMDLGSMICRPKNPLCGQCPLNDLCIARREGLEGELPARAVKAERSIEKLYVQLILCNGCALVRKRPSKGLLAGLWEFPYRTEGGRLCLVGRNAKKIRELASVSHQFTHRIWRMRGRLYIAGEGTKAPPDCIWATAGEIRALAIPSAMAHWKRIVLEELDIREGDAYETK